MVAQNPAFVIGALTTHGAELFRRALSTALPVGGGVVGANDLAVAQHSTPNMSVDVAAGEIWIPGTTSASQGSYYGRNDALVNLVISAANATNPRRDLVVASVQDAAYAGGANQWLLQVVTGTPAGSPVDPAVPASSLVLARVSVAALAASIVNANIGDLRKMLGSPYKAKYTNCNLASVNVGFSGTLTFTTVEFDPNANLASGVYTCPVAGKYRVGGSLTASTAASGIFQCSIFKNGTEYHRGSSATLNAAQNVTTQAATMVTAAAGDVIDLRSFQSSPGVLNLVAGSALSHLAVAFDSQ